MMEWKKVKLGEIGSVVGGATPLTRDASNYDGDIAWITPKDLSTLSERFISRGERMITQKGFNSCSCVMLPKGSVLFSSRAPIGYIAIAANDLCTNQGFKSIIPNEDTDNIFLYYLLKYNKEYIAGLGSGTTFMEVSGKVMKEIDLSLPPLPTQRRIAAILSSLDAQIENNNRINRNLEAQAQALFKSWFVDFEPWGGAMPEGWREGKLGEICTFKRGKNLLSKDAINEGVPVVAGGMEPSCYHNMANTGAPVITISGSGANAGFMRMYHVPVWASDCSFIDVSCPNMYFVYCFLSCNEKLLKHAQTGAVQPHVKPSDIHDFDIVIPLAETIREFQNKVQPLFLQVGNNTEANLRLASLRDTLLPKLMKGEIEV